MIEAAAGMYCKPEMDFAYRSWNIEGKKVLEIDVPRIKTIPCFALTEDNRWMAYVRVGDQNILAAPIQIKYWNRINSNLGTLIRYSDNEKILLEYLGANPFITLDKFSAIAAIPCYLAEDVIINLMIAGLVELGQNEKQTWFRLKDPGESKG